MEQEIKPRPSDIRDQNLSDVVRRLNACYERLAVLRARLAKSKRGE